MTPRRSAGALTCGGVRSVVVRRRVGLLLVLLGAVVLVLQFTGSGDGGSQGTASSPGPKPVAKKPPIATSTLGPDGTPAQLDQAVHDVLAYTPFVARGGGEEREIALTFDDGPGPYTPKILEALNRRNAKATFFFIGAQESTFHNATIAQIKRGHAVGDHTELHHRLTLLSAADQYDQLLVPFQWLSKYGLPRPVLFRPPYGAFNQTTLDQAKRLGLLMVMWTVDSQDYEKPGVEKIVDRVVAGARPGAIILMHDGGGDRSQTVKALPKIIGRLRARHYHFVSVPQMMRDDPPPEGRPVPQLSSEGG
jgi:peptidoglycan-N-acetylglucosamine deacetylase